MINHYSDHRVLYTAKSVSNSYQCASQEQLIMDFYLMNHVASIRVI